MMLAAHQETIVHIAAVEFAVTRYKESERPRGSVVLAAAEELADTIIAGNIAGNKPGEREATHEAVVFAFQHKVGKVLAVLRNEPEERPWRLPAVLTAAKVEVVENAVLRPFMPRERFRTDFSRALVAEAATDDRDRACAWLGHGDPVGRRRTGDRRGSMTHRSPPHLSPRAARVGMPLWRNPLPPSICLAPAVETASGETGRWPADAEPIGDLLYRARRLAHAADLAELDDLLSSVERAYVDGRISAEDRLALLAVHGRVFRQLSARASLNLRSARMLARS